MFNNMAAMSRGRPFKVSIHKKPSKKTATGNRHHFESFSDRIAKIKIDPIRRVHRPVATVEKDTHTNSHFASSLEEWKESNLSESFAAFSKAASPLSESLPQIVHHEDRIVELLLQYISKKDEHSLEPLLDLLTRLAHDLGSRFEKFFLAAASSVVELASTHPKIEVIEWSFNCLAWLFKLLSRLLAPDLRPLYDLLSPLFGKNPQKYFVTRYAAEAFSFLMRKAGSIRSNEAQPLRTITAHILEDLEQFPNHEKSQQLEYGLMALFSESIKGAKNSVHSSGVYIAKELLIKSIDVMGRCTDRAIACRSESVFRGTLISVLHHTTQETFDPLSEVLLSTLEEKAPFSSENTLSICAHTLEILAGVRKGSRVRDWTKVTKLVSMMVSAADKYGVPSLSTCRRDLLVLFSIVGQSCPLDAIIPYMNLVDDFSSGAWTQNFLQFCTFFANLGVERFNIIVLPRLQM